ncbi:Cytochrome P450 [Dillenia turbinata]|uniref:Cytochrome P450 n=1 Tax=Dillenia turbinata TaxID=194707 RepID=A0AAN8VP49_9MAGN
MGICLIACAILSWILIHRWSQRNNRGPKTWPLVEAAIEQLLNYDRMHDWLFKHLSQSKTVVVPMPFTTYTYIAVPANVEHVLKTNFANYPKGEAYHSYTEVLLGDGIFNVDVITETLRLNPAVPQDPKGILEDDVLPDGTRVKAEGMVTYMPYLMGRMEYNWGSDAASFKPERRLKDGVFQNASPFKFTAFQAGPRICLGKDSAYLQMKMALAILCRFFYFNLVPRHPVKYRMMTILSMEHGLKLNVNKRL